MADFADLASDASQMDLADALHRHRLQSKAPRIQPAGHCHNPLCGDDFEQADQRLFCDHKCADEYQVYGSKK